MATKFYIKETTAVGTLASFSVGKYDDAHTFNDEGVDYKTNALYFDVDKDYIRIEHSHDFIDLDEAEELKEIKAEEWEKWHEFYDEVTTKALNMLNICTLETTKK